MLPIFGKWREIRWSGKHQRSITQSAISGWLLGTEWGSALRAIDVQGSMYKYDSTYFSEYSFGIWPRSPILLSEYEDHWGMEDSYPSLKDRLVHVLNNPKELRVQNLQTFTNY